MNVQEVEARMVARITGLEEEESRMQEWLDCLRRVPEIAAQWQMKPEKEILETETLSSEPVEEFDRSALRSEEELVEERTALPYEETGARQERPHLEEDLFDALRTKLSRGSATKSEPAFGSGSLSIAGA